MIHVLRETHETPETLAHGLELAGGINRFREPNYRAIWGTFSTTPSRHSIANRS
jgi:hypothetical protein